MGSRNTTPLRNQLFTWNSVDWRHRDPPPYAFLRRLVTAAAIVGLGLAAAGCAQSMSEFARDGDGTVASAYPASSGPATLTPGDPQTVAVARPAVLVEEMTVPASQSPTARTTAPMAIAPAAAQVAEAEQPNLRIEPAAVNLNRVPEEPKSKLLTPAEKAKVIAQLEALAKKQSATLGEKSKDCAAQDLDPARRLASATGDGGC